MLKNYKDFLILRPGISNSINLINHISWNFAEQVKLPYSSQQEVC